MVIGKKVHFIGIGGYGMGPLAQIMRDMGYEVSGSDMKTSERTERMVRLGAKVIIGHCPDNLGEDVDSVVISAAIPSGNPELLKAKQLGIPIFTHAEMVGKLLDERYGIGISGAHGKTTTTSMVARVLNQNQLSPTVLIGGEVDEFSGGGKLGDSQYFVVEADEAYGRFLKMRPRIAAVTNIDDDHLDYYGSFDNVKKAFAEFIHGLPADGLAILNISDENIKQLSSTLVDLRQLTYAIDGTTADLVAIDISLVEFGSTFTVAYKGEVLGNVVLNVPGRHNVSNALVAIGVGLEVGLSFDDISKALATFTGVHRRFELHGIVGDVMVIDDYAHHPTEIMAVLKAAKNGWNRRLISIFQPQRFTRTKLLMNEFAKAFDDADIAVIADIYYEGTGEEPIEGVNSEKLARLVEEHWRAINKQGVIIHIGHLSEITSYLKSICRRGDLIITMGAGNIYEVAKQLTSEIEVVLQGGGVC